MAHARIIGQRQDRERAGRQEMLLGTTVMITLVRYGRDDGGLIVGPAVTGNAGALANAGTSAVSGDQQASGDCAAVRERNLDGRIASCFARRCAVRRPTKRADRDRTQLDAELDCLVDQGAKQSAIVYHMRKRLAWCDI